MKRDVNHELIQRAIAASNEVMVIADALQPDTPLIYVNPAFERVTGYRPDEALGRNCRFLHRDDSAQPALDQVRQALRERIPCAVLLRNYRKDGTLFWNQLQLAPMLDGTGTVTHFMGTMLDVTDRVEIEQRLLEKQRQLERSKRALEGLALKDSLTGLYNRRYFDEQLAREWNRARREQLAVSLFMIDIDHFKRFNDTYGHLAGDERLRMVGEGLRRCFARGSDLVARYGGEEFVAVTPGLQRRAARDRAELLCEAIRTLTEHAGHGEMPPVTVSVGLATATPDNRLAAEDLLETADRALYEAKRQGRDRVIQATPLRALASAA
ncbi:MAG TPA: diguanylate cyclase [Burkholderiales bacterium]|nr:diguanylate cyclase [Burkholderiales bacterium]